MAKYVFICNFCKKPFSKEYSTGPLARGPKNMEVPCPICKEIDVTFVGFKKEYIPFNRPKPLTNETWEPKEGQHERPNHLWRELMKGGEKK